MKDPYVDKIVLRRATSSKVLVDVVYFNVLRSLTNTGKQQRDETGYLVLGRTGNDQKRPSMVKSWRKNSKSRPKAGNDPKMSQQLTQNEKVDAIPSSRQYLGRACMALSWRWLGLSGLELFGNECCVSPQVLV